MTVVRDFIGDVYELRFEGMSVRDGLAIRNPA